MGSRDDDQYEVLINFMFDVEVSVRPVVSSPHLAEHNIINIKRLEKYFCKDINIFITVSFKSHQGSGVCFDSSFVILDEEASSKSHQETHECLHGLEPSKEARDYCRES